MKTFVREAIVAGAMALVGPRPLTESELQHAERQAQTQDGFIDRFHGDMLRPYPFNPSSTVQIVVAPPPITPNQFVARAESYGACVWGYAQDVARATAANAGVFDQERRILDHDAKHCRQCPEYAERGWVPIGTLPAIGKDCDCKGQCRCSFVFRNAADGVEYTAGRGPLDEDAFGRTG